MLRKNHAKSWLKTYIEFKTVVSDKENSLEIGCNEALKQIKENNYIAELIRRDIDESNIYVYGIAFQGKKTLICGGANDTIDWDKILKPKKRQTVRKKKWCFLA